MILFGLKKKPDDEVLELLCYARVEKSPGIAEDIAHYDGLEEGLVAADLNHSCSTPCNDISYEHGERSTRKQSRNPWAPQSRPQLGKLVAITTPKESAIGMSIHVNACKQQIAPPSVICVLQQYLFRRF